MPKRYTRQFKLQAVQMVLEEERPVAEVARELGVPVNLLYRWKADYLAAPESVGKLPKETTDQEVRRLRRENERLRQERDFLKKAVGFFSQNPE